MCRASLFAFPAAIFAFILVSVDDIWADFRKDLGLSDASKSQLWSATTGVLVIMLGFRTNRAMSRFWEGTGLLHQMRGEWFDSVSCCITFSRKAMDTKPIEVKNFRHTIVRLMSLCHGSALQEIAGDQSGNILFIDSFGLDNDTLRHLKECKEKHGFNRVEVLLHLTQSIITKAFDDNVLNIPPPILSRVYQTLSRGFVNLLNAKKIADTRFPFPYAQIITMLLFIHVLLTPIMISCLMEHKVMCPLFTFVPIFGMFYLNFVGVELENPFGDDDNDLPLDHFQSEMNNCLLMLLQENADLISTIDDRRCTTDFLTLKESLREADHGENNGKADGINNKRISQFEWSSIPDDGDEDAFVSQMSSMISQASRNASSKVFAKDSGALRSLGETSPEKETKATSNIPETDWTSEMSTSEAQRPVEQLKPTIFNGAIDTFLEANRPHKDSRSTPREQDLFNPASDVTLNVKSLGPPTVFVLAQPYTGRGTDEQSSPFPSAEPSPDPSSTLTRTSSPATVPKTTKQRDHRSSKKDASLNPVSSGRSKGGSAVLSGPEPKILDQGIETSMGEFKEALDNWTQVIEGQLTELRQNVAALRRFSDTIPDLLELRKNP